MVLEERQRYAYELHYYRKKSYREIGEMFGGISGAYVGKLINKHKNWLDRFAKAETEWEKKLVLRSGNIEIENHLQKEDLLKHPEEIVNTGPKKLMNLRIMNTERLSIIAVVLEECGYIENASKWLGIEIDNEKLNRCPYRKSNKNEK